jgi:protoporphyrinogen oxidase
MSNVSDALVIGAGPAGLTAAYLLAKAGKSVVVVEQHAERVGGLSQTVEHKGFLFDIGGHRFFSKSNAVVDLWHEILPSGFLKRRRLSRIYYAGKFYSYPLRPFEALRNLGFRASTGCILSYLRARIRPIRTPLTFHDWVRNQFGERLFSIFFRTYTEKIWGMSCDRISADWAAQRIAGLNLGKAVWSGLVRRDATKQAGIKTLADTFLYPRRGPGMLWEEAARKTVSLGGELLMGSRVAAAAFDRASGLWTVTVARPDGSSERYTTRNVISSAPIRELAAMITPALDAQSAAEKLRYRDFLIVALIVKGPPRFADNWIYVHDPGVKVGRVQNFAAWSPEMVPDRGLACLGLEYFCFEGDRLWTMADDELVALASREIVKIGLAAQADLIEGVVVRQPKAYPVYDEDYRAHVDAVRREIEQRFPGLHLVGRNGMHKYNNQDHAMMTAMLTVENVLANERRYDVWNVNQDAEYHESHSGRETEALDGERMIPQAIT